MNYKNFSDTQSERAQINDKIINSYTPEEEIGVTILDEKQEKKLKKKLKNKAFDHYKQHGNLNELIYSTNNQEVKKKLEKWMEKFYLNCYEEKKNLTKEVEGEEIKNRKKMFI